MKCPIGNSNCPVEGGRVTVGASCPEVGCPYKGGNALIPTIGTVAICGAIAVGGYFIFKDKIDPLIGIKPTPISTVVSTPTPTTTSIPDPTISPTPTITSTPITDSNVVTIESVDASLPNPQVLTMDGSVTMVKMIKLLRNGYAQVNPNVPTTYGFDTSGQPKDGDDVRPTGSSSGLKNLKDQRVLMVATSRPLKPDEAQAGIRAIPIARDAIAVVVGINNQFQGSLTKSQLRDIYTGRITNWADLGGANLPIKVYNRSSDSGTQSFFKDDVLLDEKFALEGSNFKTWERDETTAVLRVLGNDGIYYTTVSQAERQELVRVVPIDGISPLNRKAILDRTYPIVRYVYLAIPKQTSPAVKQFIEFALSPEGQRIVDQAEFIKVK
jgi:phosphate transport system substrate-binding protein